jgi:DNA modification methylase
MENKLASSKSVENMKVTLWSLDRIIPYARNARKIPPEAVDKIAASIQEFGWRQPIVVDKDGVIICGHVRLLAAQKLGLTDAPVHVADNLSPAQVRAYRLLDNRSHEETGWDKELLGLELLDLKHLDLNLELTGFNMDEIDRFLSEAQRSVSGFTDDDAVPELTDSAVTRPGDLWRLGPHRILCGDSTSPTSFEKLLGDTLADLVITDPPYNVSYSGGSSKNRGNRRPIANDDLGLGFEQFLFQVCQNILEVSTGAVYIAMSSSEIDTLKRAFTQAGGHWSTFVIWAKNTFTLGRSDYQRQYEPILYGWKEGGPHHWCGDRDQGDVWFVNKPVANDLHPTQKPVELMERAIRNSSLAEEMVLDPFAGSGTTLIACQKSRRYARLIELDPRYVDCGIKRWQAWTGERALRDCDGRSFDEISEGIKVL